MVVLKLNGLNKIREESDHMFTQHFWNSILFKHIVFFIHYRLWLVSFRWWCGEFSCYKRRHIEDAVRVYTVGK